MELSQAQLKDANVLVLTGLSRVTSPANVALQEFCRLVKGIISVGGNVIVPCFQTGICYDIIELLRTMASKQQLQLTVFCVSPIAQFSLSYANVQMEWLCDARQKLQLNHLCMLIR